jgi:hypothetical protein
VNLPAWHEAGHVVHRVKVTGFPRIPINEGTLTIAGVVTAIGLSIVRSERSSVGCSACGSTVEWKGQSDLMSLLEHSP